MRPLRLSKRFQGMLTVPELVWTSMEPAWFDFEKKLENIRGSWRCPFQPSLEYCCSSPSNTVWNLSIKDLLYLFVTEQWCGPVCHKSLSCTCTWRETQSEWGSPALYPLWSRNIFLANWPQEKPWTSTWNCFQSENVTSRMSWSHPLKLAGTRTRCWPTKTERSPRRRCSDLVSTG